MGENKRSFENGWKRRARGNPVGQGQNIRGASPVTSEEERRWKNPETAGGEHCAERMGEIQKACGRGEIQAFPMKNQESGEYDADGEWALSMGGPRLGNREHADGNMGMVRLWAH